MRIGRTPLDLICWVALIFLFSACTLFKKQSSETFETPSAYPSPVLSPGVDSASDNPTGQSSEVSKPALAYPAPAAVNPGQGAQPTLPYPAPASKAAQSSAYPGPGKEMPTAASPINPGTPVQTITTPIPYPLRPTQAQFFPSATPNASHGQPPLSQTVVPTVTLTATPGIVRTNIIATDPSTVSLASGRPQLVEFFAYWCILCKSMAPVINGLEVKYADRVNFIYLDVDNPKTNSIKEALGYTLIANPRIFLLDGQGKIIREWIGYVPVDELEAALSSVVG